MTTDTTAPAADLREAIEQHVHDAMWEAITIERNLVPHKPASERRVEALHVVADRVLALIAPRLAAAREEGRREGIEQAARELDAKVADARAELGRLTTQFVKGLKGRVVTQKWAEAKKHAEKRVYYYSTAATAIRALADAPRTAEREGG